MSTGPDHNRLDYVAATVTLRAPRIAVVIPDRPEWHRWVIHVLEQCGNVWGGAGFVLIPHTNGEVHPLWLQLARAYDPDHVVTAEAPIPDLAECFPEEFLVRLDGRILAPQEVREKFPNERRVLSAHDEQARESVAAACTPFLRPSGATHHAQTRLPFTMQRGAEAVTEDTGPRLDLGMDIDKGDLEVAAAWLASSKGVAPAGYDDGAAPSDRLTSAQPPVHRWAATPWQEGGWDSGVGWQPSLRGLTRLLYWPARDVGWLIVGDTLADFALAHYLSRMFHFAQWIPAAWLHVDSPFRSAARSIAHQASYFKYQGNAFLVSLSEDLQTLPDRVKQAEGIFVHDEPAWQTDPGLQIAATTGGGFLACKDDFARDMALPVRVSRDGDRTLVTRLPPQVPQTAEVLQHPEVEWVTDVSFADHNMPRGRGFPPKTLETGDSQWREQVRSGRDGLAVASQSMGWVSAGAPLHQRIARPILAAPSLRTWASEMARTSGVKFETSDAGQVAAVVTRLSGSRKVLADDLWAYREMFSEFLVHKASQKTDERYPEHDGCVIKQEGFLTWDAARRSVPATSVPDDDLRTDLDRLVTSGVLRRGLIMRCPDCSEVQFTAPENPDFSSTCSRCRANIALVQSNWHRPVHEPRWHYDLHPVMRRLVRDHGDVPLLAERHLRTEHARLEGLPEFNLRGKIGQGSPLEIDLLAATEDLVIVLEAKTRPSIRGKDLSKKAEGLAKAARMFQADEVILAAGETGMWQPEHRQALEQALDREEWDGGKAPRTRLLSGLYQADVTDELA